MDIWTKFQVVLDAAAERERALKVQVAEERERVKAMEIVVRALVASQGWRGFDRRRFARLIDAAGQETPNEGPESVRHAVLLAQARKVLGDPEE